MAERSVAAALARFVQDHREEIAQAVIRELHPMLTPPAQPLLYEWLDSLITQLRGGPGHSYEWSARAYSDTRAAGVSWELLFIQVMKLRAWFLAYLEGREDAPHGAEATRCVNEIEEEYVRHLAALCAQGERDAIAAERRSLASMAEAAGRAFVVVDGEGRITMVNSQCARFLGAPTEALQGASLADYCDPEAAGELRRLLRQRRGAAVRAFTGNLRSVRATLLPSRFTAYPIFDGQGLRCGLAISISDLDQPGELPPLQRLELLDRIGDSLNIGFQLLDQEGRVVYTSSVARQLLGVSPDQRPYCDSLLKPFAPADAQPVWADVLQDGLVRHEVVLCPGGGENRWIEITIVPDRAPTNVVTRVVCLFRDVTQHRTLERSLIEQQRTSLASQLAVAVAHQLRNPLSVMIGFAEMLSTGMAPDKMRDAIERLLRNGLRCKKIVEDLLEFGQGLPGEQAVVDLNTLVRDTVGALKHLPPGSIEVRPAPSACLVSCSARQLTEVFSNLIENAIQAGARHVTLSVERLDDAVRVRVRDDGPGVPEELRDSVFQPFFSTRREKGSIGLGLSLSQFLVQDYGSRLYLESAADPGAVFAVVLPLVPEKQPPQEVPVPVKPPEARHRLLVVDDEADLLDLLKAALSVNGWEVDTAGTAGEALPLIDKNTYDMAVLDVQLPGELSGQQLYQYLRGTAPRLADRVLFITADTMNYETRKFLAEVQRPFLEKPFLVSSFVEEARTILEAPGDPEPAG